MRAHNRGLFRKLLVMTSVFLLVIFAIVALITYQSITQTQRSFERSVRAQALSIASTVDQEISSVRTLLSSLQSETNLRRLAVAYEAVSMYERKLMVDSAVSFLINVSNATQTVDHVDVYFPHIRRVLSSKQPTYNELDDQEIAALQRDGILNAYAHHTSMVPLANGQYAVTAVFPSNENAIRTEKLFVVAAYISSEKMSRLLQTQDRTGSMHLALMNGDRVYASSGAMTARQWADLTSPDQNGQFFSLDSGERYLLCSARSSMMDMDLLLAFPVGGSWSDPDKFSRLLVLCLGTVGVLILLFLFYMRRRMIKPMERMLQALSHMTEGQDYHIASREQDEFGYIYQRFDEMLDRIRDLKSQVAEEQLRTRQAQLRQLQYQIRPHFLYNNFYQIYRMARHEESDDISAFVSELSAYYRYITQLPDEALALRYEYEHIGHYLAIQETRFGTQRFHAEMEPLDEDTGNLLIPPLTLQPIVENACEHGLKHVTSGGRIHVSVRQENEMVIFCVQDNGLELTDEQIAALSCRLEQNEETADSSGMFNVHRRLRIRCGEGSGVQVQRSAMGGLQVTVRIRPQGKSASKEE